MTLYSATLNPSGPNYQAWLDILGNPNVPLKSAEPVKVALGDKEHDGYLLNLDGLTLRQKARLLGAMAQKFGVSISEVDQEIRRVGFPIQAADVIVSVSVRAIV